MIALNVNLEMARGFPTPGELNWDYEKGNLDEANKRYAVAVARFAKARGVRLTFSVVGRVLEQDDVSWLVELHREGHCFANHTYDHAFITADTPEKLQFRFRRAPWLVAGRTVADVVEENIRLTAQALKKRLGVDRVRGFRASEDLPNGLRDLPERQEMLQRLGFDWAGTLYAAVPVPANSRPSKALMAAIKAGQAKTQPFVYPSGLVEIPKGPVGDITAFRTGQWPLEDFLESVRVGMEWALENRGLYCLAVHSSVMAVRDPQLKTLELMLAMVEAAKGSAEILTMDEIADRIRARG